MEFHSSSAIDVFLGTFQPGLSMIASRGHFFHFLPMRCRNWTHGKLRYS